MEDEIVQSKIDSFIDTFKEIRERIAGNDEVARVILQELSKDRRAAMIQRNNGNQVTNNGDMPASEKQLAFLRRLGVTVDPEYPMSKRQASELIDKNLEAQHQDSLKEQGFPLLFYFSFFLFVFLSRMQYVLNTGSIDL